MQQRFIFVLEVQSYIHNNKYCLIITIIYNIYYIHAKHYYLLISDHKLKIFKERINYNGYECFDIIAPKGIYRF